MVIRLNFKRSFPARKQESQNSGKKPEGVSWPAAREAEIAGITSCERGAETERWKNGIRKARYRQKKCRARPCFERCVLMLVIQAFLAVQPLLKHLAQFGNLGFKFCTIPSGFLGGSGCLNAGNDIIGCQSQCIAKL